VLQHIVVITADEVVGTKERMVRNGWFDEEWT
jgi:hypothetical protein